MSVVRLSRLMPTQSRLFNTTQELTSRGDATSEAIALDTRLALSVKDVGSASMLRSVLVLALLALSSCDIFYGVVKHAEPGTGFDASIAQDVVRQHPDCIPAAGYPWDGETMLCVARRGEAEAGVGYSAGGRVTVESLWTGRLPAQRVVDEALRLQSELIRLLRARFPKLPPETDWSVDWVRMEAQQGAAADDRPQAGDRG